MKRFIKIKKPNVFTEWIESILVINFYNPYMLDYKVKLGIDMINLLSKTDARYEIWVHYFINISKDFGMHPDTLAHILRKHPNSEVAVEYLSKNDSTM
ncbi:hypothetical protein ACMGE7_01940 [Macrococcus equi]|uniref:hypothetical protein n=1 Tax=Macrococcus equi TaxID=3395462 RepID=UPI0039BDE376